MTLLLDAGSVGDLVTLEHSIDALRHGLGARSVDPADAQLSLLRTPSGWLRLMAAVADGAYVGFKAIHKVDGKGVNYLLALYDLAEGDCVALLDADALTTWRTAAVAAIATDALARVDSNVVGCYGSSREAAAQLRAAMHVRPIVEARISSPSRTNRERFAHEMADELGIDVRAVEDPAAAAQGADIIISATNSERPFLSAGWLTEGVHYNAMGSTRPEQREAHGDCYLNAGVLVVDAPESIFRESGDLVEAQELGLDPGRAVSLVDLVSRGELGRTTEEEVTVFKSVGSASFDVVLALDVWRRAAEAQVGLDVGAFPLRKDKA